MRKGILFLAMITGMNLANAQDVVFDDYNTTRSNYWNYYNSNYISSPEANPSAVGNTSAEVGKYTRIAPTLTNDEYQGLGCKLAGWAAFDFFTSYNTVEVDVYAAQAFSLSLVLQDNGSVNYDVQTVSQNYVAGDVNTWKKLTFDFSASSSYSLTPGNGYALLWKFDDGLMNATALDYYVDNFKGKSLVSGVKGKANTSVSKLEQNSPNPASINTSINYSLSQSSEVSLAIYDVFGKEVTNLLENVSQGSGDHNMIVNVQNMNEGLYYYTLTVGGISETKKMVVQK